MTDDTFTSTEDAAAFAERMRVINAPYAEDYDPYADYEPDPPEFHGEEDDLPVAEPEEIPADWVEGHDDNSASERGSHWEDE